jgi:hypothetical protein
MAIKGEIEMKGPIVWRIDRPEYLSKFCDELRVSCSTTADGDLQVRPAT